MLILKKYTHLQSKTDKLPLHEKTPLHKIKCVVKSLLKATFDTPLITFDSRQR